MWIFGLLVSYLLYRFLVVWYLSLWSKSRTEKAYYWDKASYHVVIIAVAALLLAFSMFLFSLTDGWLALVPLPLIASSYYMRRRKNGHRLREAIKTAVVLEYRLKEQGQPRSIINREIVKHLLGSDPSEVWVGADWDVGSVLKCYILPQLGLYQVSNDLALRDRGAPMLGPQIDAAIEFYESALGKTSAAG